MDNARFKVLFQRYIDEACTESEKAEFWEMVESGKNDEALRSMMDSLWQSSALRQTLPRHKADQIVNEILSGAPVIPIQRAATREPSRFAWPSFAAKAAAVAVIGVAGLYAVGDFILEERASRRISSDVRVEVPIDEHRFVQLPDNSLVILNAGSTLDYAGLTEGSATREVTLTGEAYFDIRHDPDRPFIVHTGKLKTTVLGTAFNIRAYAEDNNITVTVTRGKVKVSDEEREIGILNPDQQITFDGKNHKVEQQVDSKKAVAWAENDIFFNEVTVGEAARRLEERFGVQIEFDNEALQDCRFTATFIHNEDLDQILSVICEFNNATYSKERNTVVITGDGC